MKDMQNDIKRQVEGCELLEIDFAGTKDITESMRFKFVNNDYYVEHIFKGFRKVTEAVGQFLESLDYVAVGNSKRKIRLDISATEFFKKIESLGGFAD